MSKDPPAGRDRVLQRRGHGQQLGVPFAAALYGVLLGLGFTTFVLSFAVYALAAACLALGVPSVGVAVGLAFAVGRILPVVVLAPMQSTERGTEQRRAANGLTRSR